MAEEVTDYTSLASITNGYQPDVSGDETDEQVGVMNNREVRTTKKAVGASATPPSHKTSEHETERLLTTRHYSDVSSDGSIDDESDLGGERVRSRSELLNAPWRRHGPKYGQLESVYVLGLGYRVRENRSKEIDWQAVRARVADLGSRAGNAVGNAISNAIGSVVSCLVGCFIKSNSGDGDAPSGTDYPQASAEATIGSRAKSGSEQSSAGPPARNAAFSFGSRELEEPLDASHRGNEEPRLITDLPMRYLTGSEAASMLQAGLDESGEDSPAANSVHEVVEQVDETVDEVDAMEKAIDAGLSSHPNPESKPT